jgi:hypothetical protein
MEVFSERMRDAVPANESGIHLVGLGTATFPSMSTVNPSSSRANVSIGKATVRFRFTIIYRDLQSLISSRSRRSPVFLMLRERVCEGA